MSPQEPPAEVPPAETGDEDTQVISEGATEQPAPKHAPERRRFRRYRMSLPVWLSYGQNYRQVESGRVHDFSKAGLYLVTEGGEDLHVGDVVKVNATFAVRGEARIVRLEPPGEGPRGVALEFTHKLELDI